jgi:hypothetical protein
MIDIDKIIEESSEEKIKEFILNHFKMENKEIIFSDLNFFIEFIKSEQFISSIISSDERKNGRLLLVKLLNIFNLTDKNIDELYEYIKTNAIEKLIRVTDWELTGISLLSVNTVNEHINCYSAEFIYRNNWGNESDKETYKIFKYKNSVIWISSNRDEPQHIISQNGRLFGLAYTHKNLTIYKNLNNIYKEISFDNLDDIITQYKNTNFNIGREEIELSGYFDKRFFYLGILADRAFMSDRNFKSKITKIKTIDFSEGPLKIEIENITYPHTGFILLDIENCKIIKAERINV